MDFPRLNIKTRELIEAVEDCLKEACASKDKFGGVNWGDLGVKDVEYRLSMLLPSDGPCCVVIIEEASPDCKLPAFIYDRIRERFPNVYIECEW